MSKTICSHSDSVGIQRGARYRTVSGTAADKATTYVMHCPLDNINMVSFYIIRSLVFRVTLWTIRLMLHSAWLSCTGFVIIESKRVLEWKLRVDQFPVFYLTSLTFVYTYMYIPVNWLSSYLPVRNKMMWRIYEIIHICYGCRWKFQWLKLENLLRWSFFTFIYNGSSNMNYFKYSSHKQNKQSFVML